MNIKQVLVILALAFTYGKSWSQTKVPYLWLINNEGVIITSKDSIVSKKFFQSPIVMLETDEPMANGTEIMLMLGEKGIFFESTRLSVDIKQQIMKLPEKTEIVFTVEQKTIKELKFLIVE